MSPRAPRDEERNHDVRERLARPTFSGRLLETHGNVGSRDMITPCSFWSTRQNPAYQSTPCLIFKGVNLDHSYGGKILSTPSLHHLFDGGVPLCYHVTAFFTAHRSRPHRLVRPRTPAFQAGNTGSNPVGDASIKKAAGLPFSGFFVLVRINHQCLDEDFSFFGRWL